VIQLETVERFVMLTARCLDQIKLQYAGTERPTLFTGLWLRSRAGGDLVRSGSLEGLGTFRLHGTGCAFELDTGEDLDVDWNLDDGRAVFDSWRIYLFALSQGDSFVERESLRVAASELQSIVQLDHDLFTWPDHRYDIVNFN
jgi:hypothetical protein